MERKRNRSFDRPRGKISVSLQLIRPHFLVLFLVRELSILFQKPVYWWKLLHPFVERKTHLPLQNRTLLGRHTANKQKLNSLIGTLLPHRILYFGTICAAIQEKKTNMKKESDQIVYEFTFWVVLGSTFEAIERCISFHIHMVVIETIIQDCFNRFSKDLVRTG
jgi:hypothetical protein